LKDIVEGEKKGKVITKGVLKGKLLRPSQRQGVEFIKNSKRRFIGVNMPTGGGKSILAMESMSPPLFYVCSSKHLQDQIAKDFPEIVVLKGRENYKCNADVFSNVSECFIQSCAYECEYKETKNRAMSSDYAVINYHYFLTLFNYAGETRVRNVVFDEADVLEYLLVDFISFVVDTNIMYRRGIHIRPKSKTKVEDIIPFLRDVVAVCKEKEVKEREKVREIEKRLNESKRVSMEDIKTVKRYKWYNSTHAKCSFLLTQDLSTWVYYYSGERIYLKPKWITRDLADKYLFKHGNRFLFMSATLPSYPIFCGLYGLGLDEVDYIQFDSEFHPDNRPVIFEPKWKLSKKNGFNEDKIRAEVKKLLEKEKEKGLIHTVNYKLSECLKGLDDRLLIHSPEDKDRVFHNFLKSKDKVFVSPSSIRGVDLPDDLVRWILFIKSPFADLSDPLTSARAFSGKFGNLWYKQVCVQDIVQGAGRGCRHKNDWVRVYVWDELALQLLKNNPSLFPKWFREAVEIR